MKEKIANILNRYLDTWSDGFDGGACVYSHNLPEVNDEIYALRYQIAREVQEEFRNQFNYTFTHFPNWTEYCEWLDQQEQE